MIRSFPLGELQGSVTSVSPWCELRVKSKARLAEATSRLTSREVIWHKPECQGHDEPEEGPDRERSC